MKKPAPPKHKTLKIEAESHRALKRWCDARGVKIQFAAEAAIAEYIKARPGGGA